MFGYSVEEKRKSRNASSGSLRLSPNRSLVENNRDLFAGLRLARGTLKLLFLLRGWQSDFGVSRGSPDLGHKVLVAKTVEHHQRLG